jgi:hypothetical protein
MLFAKFRDEAVRSAHRAHRVRTRWTNADFEQFEGTCVRYTHLYLAVSLPTSARKRIPILHD